MLAIPPVPFLSSLRTPFVLVAVITILSWRRKDRDSIALLPQVLEQSLSSAHSPPNALKARALRLDRYARQSGARRVGDLSLDVAGGLREDRTARKQED